MPPTFELFESKLLKQFSTYPASGHVLPYQLICPGSCVLTTHQGQVPRESSPSPSPAPEYRQYNVTSSGRGGRQPTLSLAKYKSASLQFYIHTQFQLQQLEQAHMLFLLITDKNIQFNDFYFYFYIFYTFHIGFLFSLLSVSVRKKVSLRNPVHS